MPPTLTFLHTSPVHIATFDQLISALAPALPVRHLVDEQLLADARAAGLTPELAERVAHAIVQAADDGAAVVVCTCSTIGGCAEAAAEVAQRPVLRVDRAMAERAVALGRRVTLAAALASTLAPTRALLEAVAAEQRQPIIISELACADAWAHFEAGDLPAYHQAIAAQLHAAADLGDVVVLAQASMAGAAALCADLAVPILSSPQLGAEAAVHAYQRVMRDA